MLSHRSEIFGVQNYRVYPITLWRNAQYFRPKSSGKYIKENPLKLAEMMTVSPTTA